MPTYDAVRRRLIVCCDGTWQSSTSGERNIPSNVTRLCRHLARSQVVQEVNPTTKKTETVLYNQMVFYDPGIGTGDLSAIDVNRQGGTGAGLAMNVIEAYNWLVLNYQPGDKIYCFGFSRGAYTARSLAGFIAELGICQPLDMMYFPIIYDLYEGAIYPPAKDDSKEILKARVDYEEKKALWESGGSLHFNLGNNDLDQKLRLNTGPREKIDPESKKVEVVGVWDTVGSLGVPKIEGWLKMPTMPWSTLDKPGRAFHDVRVSDHIQHAFHALALDERRRPFTPTLWYVPIDQPRGAGLSLKQVWFPGVHINVGGGSDDILKERKSDYEQIANITFAWMIEQCRPFLAFDEDSLEHYLVDQEFLMKRLHDDYKVDNAKTGWAKGAIIDSFTEAAMTIKMGGSRWRSPGETWQPESIASKTEKRTTELGTTNEEIHPCVFYRMSELGQRSPALEKFQRKAVQGNPKNGWEWTKKSEDGKTTLRLPESRIQPHSTAADAPKNHERRVAESNGAGPYLALLDQMYDTGVDKTKPDTFTKLSI